MKADQLLIPILLIALLFCLEYGAVDEHGNSAFFKPSDIFSWMIAQFYNFNFCLAERHSIYRCILNGFSKETNV